MSDRLRELLEQLIVVARERAALHERERELVRAIRAEEQRET